MLLRIEDRLILMNVLPVEENYTTLKLIQELRSALGFSEEELEEFGLVLEEGTYHWKPEANSATKDVPVGERAFDTIKLAFQKLDAQKRIQPALMPLYEHFVLDQEWRVEDACKDTEDRPQV